MGSDGDGWLACKACGFDTKCGILPNGVFCLIDSEDSGMMCNPCYKSLSSAYPQLTLWWFEDKLPSPVAKTIERMAYPVWNLINLIGARNWNGASTVAECAIIYHRSVARFALKKVTGYFLVSSISDGGRGRRTQNALRRRNKKADARGWTHESRQRTKQWSTSQSSTSQWSSSEWSSSEWNGAWSSSEWHGAWHSSESPTHGGGDQLVRD